MNSPAPLEEPIFEGEKVLEIYVDDPNDPEEVLNKLKLEIKKLRGVSNAALAVNVVTESGSRVLGGEFKDGFEGVVTSYPGKE